MHETLWGKRIELVMAFLSAVASCFFAWVCYLAHAIGWALILLALTCFLCRSTVRAFREMQTLSAREELRLQFAPHLLRQLKQR